MRADPIGQAPVKVASVWVQLEAPVAATNICAGGTSPVPASIMSTVSPA
jgi:hypothetical protein